MTLPIPLWTADADSGRVGLQFVEDVLNIVMLNSWNSAIREGILKDPWFDKFVTNVYSWAIVQNKPLTTEQARITLRILQKTGSLIVEKGWATSSEVERLIETPRYRHRPTPSANIPREVRYLGDNLLGLRFKRNDHIATQLKLLKNSSGDPVARWDWLSRLWIVPVLRTTLEPLMTLIGENRFGIDDDVAEFLARASNSVDQPASFELRDGKIIATINDDEVVSAWVECSLRGEIT